MLKLHFQLFTGFITSPEEDNHLSPLAAMLYVYHMAFKKTITSAVQLVYDCKFFSIYLFIIKKILPWGSDS